MYKIDRRGGGGGSKNHILGQTRFLNLYYKGIRGLYNFHLNVIFYCNSSSVQKYISFVDYYYYYWLERACTFVANFWTHSWFKNPLNERFLRILGVIFRKQFSPAILVKIINRGNCA